MNYIKPNSKVSIIQCDGKNIEEKINQLIDMLGNFKKLINENIILIKPNLVWPVESGTGIITDSRIVEALTKIVLEYNPKKVIIGEGCGVGYMVRKDAEINTFNNFKISGILNVAKKYGVKLIDLNKDYKVQIELNNYFVMKKFNIAKTLLDADVKISVPVLKTHGQATITCSLKNMKGALPGAEKRLTHKVGLEKAIVDLNRITKPDFSLVDAIRGMQGMWRYPEDVVDMNLMVAGYDPVSVDTVCSILMGIDPSKVLHLKLAQEANLGNSDLSKIQVLGENPSKLARRFITYFEAVKEGYPFLSLIENNACTGCIGEIRNMLGFLDNSGLIKSINKLQVITGNPQKIPEEDTTSIVIGKCAYKYRDRGTFIPGCPPHGKEIALNVCRLLNLNEKKLLETIRKIE